VTSQNGPWRITFDTNPDACNLHCVMCEEHSEYCRKEKNDERPRLMDFDIIQSVIQEMSIRGLKEIIPSTMGEPLLYNRFLEIVELCKQYGLKLNLTTNGTWPCLGARKWAQVLCPIASDIKVSWNGATAHTQESIMRGSSWPKRIADLHEFISIRDAVASASGNRCRITLQCTFMEDNVEELPDLIRIAIGLGIDRVKGHHIWVHFPEMNQQDLRRSQDSRIRWNRVVEQCRNAAGKEIILENFVTLPVRSDANLPYDWVCPFLGKEAWVNHWGRFDPCCAPDEERALLGRFGYITGKDGMSAIWDGQDYAELVKDYKSHPVCQKCNMRRLTSLSGGSA